MIYPLLRSLLFRLNPESAHALTINLLRFVGGLFPLRILLSALYSIPQDPVIVFGLQFPNRLGLAAGYDKDGLGWRGLACLGFGHIEVGTVTPLPQLGNPKPRLFRLPDEKALINCMGFPSKGMEFLKNRLKESTHGRVMIGVNIGKNKGTPLSEAIQDYLTSMKGLYPLADYIAINVSSPNTEGLRDLQSTKPLQELLDCLGRQRRDLEQSQARKVPFLVKLAPDLSDDELDGALDAILNSGIDGVIATNTTIARDKLDSPWRQVSGGLSGAPLTKRSTKMISDIYTRTQGQLPIIGVGGVMSAQDACEKLRAGATLVQVYSGLVYAGPRLIKEIIEATRAF
jgi:dihydroorotate dehydrogenase